MGDFNYALDKSCYSWKNALTWGYFSEHVQKAMKGKLEHRIVHALIAWAEFFPIIGQVASVFEKIIVCKFAFKQTVPETQKENEARLFFETADFNAQWDDFAMGRDGKRYEKLPFNSPLHEKIVINLKDKEKADLFGKAIKNSCCLPFKTCQRQQRPLKNGCLTTYSY